MKENGIIKLIKRLKAIKPFKGIPRGNSNRIWERFKLKEAESCYKRGLYSKAEYEQKIKEIKLKCSGLKEKNVKQDC